MNSLDVLSLLLDGFGWALVLVCCAACVAYLYRDSLVSLCERTIAIDYEGLDDETVAEIEDARAELARKARDRAAKSQESADVARFDAYAAFAFYVPAWEGKWEDVALSRIRERPISQLVALSGIGAVRARRIVDSGASLDFSALRRICTLPVANHALRCV
jgi:hypothetical protein